MSSPIPYPSADAPGSIVLTLKDEQIVRLDTRGREMLRYDAGDEIEAMPAVADAALSLRRATAAKKG